MDDLISLFGCNYDKRQKKVPGGHGRGGGERRQEEEGASKLEMICRKKEPFAFRYSSIYNIKKEKK